MNLFKLAWPGAADDQEDMSEQQVITSAQAWRGAGGGRGATSGMRLDTDSGQREWAVEQEVQRLAAINPASRERLRALAQFNLSQPVIEPKPVDREAQYMARGYASADAAANAQFDANLEQRLNARAHKARPDAATGERIVQRYNPNSERERVVAEAKEMHALRADARQRAAAQEMPSVVRGLAQGAAGLYATSMGAFGLAGELTGNEDLRDWGLEGYRETMRGVNNIRHAPTFTGIRSTGDAVEWALENSGYAGFQAATTILSAGMGGLIANTVGKKALGEAVGIALNSTVQTFGSVYGEAAEEARRSGKPLDLPTMLAGATVSTAIDTLADRIGLNALSTQTFKGNALERLGKSVGTQMAVQGGTEAAQRVPEELGAGRDPLRKGTGAQYVDDFAAGALFGAHAGTVGGLRGGEPTGASAQPGTHRADVPLVGEQHTTPTPPVHAEQASALPEDYLPVPSDLPPDRALGGAERANPPAAQAGSERAMVSEPAAHMAQATMDPQGGAAQAEPAQEVAQPMAAAVLRMDTQPTGTLAVTGDPALIRDALLQAGVVAEDIFPGSQGALVAPRSAERAWGTLSPLAQALDAGSGRQGPVLPVASPALTPSHPGMVLLDGGSLAVTGGDPAEIVDQLLRAGIAETERLQIPGGVLVPPGSVQKVLQIFSATGAEKLVPARSGFHNGAQAFDGPPAWPMHALPPGPVFANRFPDDARELRDMPVLTTDQALRMPANVLYVVKENGALIMARKPHDPGGFGHVDLARGEKVIAAGEAKVLWGTVKYIDNASGHYLPNGDAAAAAAVKAFRNHGFQVSDERYINKIFDFKSRKWVKK